MNFLYPLFLAGALAVVLPIVFHLIRRSSKDKVPFSTLRFLQPSPPRLTKKSRLEHLFLLLLRCLILVLLALAFARPYLEKALDVANTAENPQRNLILLDASASMRRASLWEQAQDALADQVNQIDSAALAAAYTFDHQLHPIITFEQWASAPQADRAIQIIRQAKQRQPSWKATHLGNALLTAVDLLEESTRIGEHSEDHQDWRIIVIGDLQAGMLLDGIQGFDWPKGCVVEFHPIQEDSGTNAGIHAIAQPSASSGLVENEGARVRISNAAGADRETFRYGWVTTPMSANVVSSTEIYLPPGKSRVVDVPETPPGFGPDLLKLVGDDHPFDNLAWRVPLRARESKVLFLGAPSQGDTTQPLYYLRKAFQQTRRHLVTVDVHPPDQPLLDDLLESARLIVIGAPLGQSVADQVARAIEAGTTALLALSDPALEPTLRTLARDPLLDLRPSQSQRYALLGEIDFQHPLFVPFADPRFSDFSKISFWKHYQMDFEGHERARTIARFDNGLAAITQVSQGMGSLFVCAFGWQPQQSQFALSTKFVPLLYAFLDFGAGVHEVNAHYHVGQEVDLSSLTAEGGLTIETPGGEAIAMGERQRFTETSQPGIYRIKTDPVIRFAVNLHPSESNTAPILEETLMGLGVPTAQTTGTEAPNPIVEEAQRKLKAAELESNQKVWKWIVLAALVIATLETLSAALISRRQGGAATLAGTR